MFAMQVSSVTTQDDRLTLDAVAVGVTSSHALVELDISCLDTQPRYSDHTHFAYVHRTNLQSIKARNGAK